MACDDGPVLTTTAFCCVCWRRVAGTEDVHSKIVYRIDNNREIERMKRIGNQIRDVLYISNTFFGQVRSAKTMNVRNSSLPNHLFFFLYLLLLWRRDFKVIASDLHFAQKFFVDEVDEKLKKEKESLTPPESTTSNN